MIYIVFTSYKLGELFRLVCHTVDQIFEITIGCLFRLKPINYEYKPIPHREYSEKNILDFQVERSKIFEKKYEKIDFLVLNNYISFDEGNKQTDRIMKDELRVGFYHNLRGYYYYD